MPWNVFIDTRKIRKKCVGLENVSNHFKNRKSGVPQVSVIGSILFNAYWNDFFYYIRKASADTFDLNPWLFKIAFKQSN